MEYIKYVYKTNIRTVHSEIRNGKYKGKIRPILISEKHPKVTFFGLLKEGKIQIGVSVCSEKDSFEKKKGRKLAEDRAKHNPFMVINHKLSGHDFSELCENLSKTFIENRRLVNIK